MANLRIRQNVFELGDDWADPILWYARGVKAMKSRALAEPTSWNFYGAIHGIRRWLWDFYQFTETTDADPGAADTQTYLDQCQHQSWYFLPWHRGYLLALEQVLLAEIKLLGGPHTTWALPYWNYFHTGQNMLPPAFGTENWPDGTDDNPLFVKQRWGLLGGSSPFDVSSITHLNSIDDADFSGPSSGGNTGFGGPETGFNWLEGDNGGIENNPHNFVHGLIGGAHSIDKFPSGTPFVGNFQHGIMSDPLTAALDPIFYLHHCNIDRLWQSWNAYPADKTSNKPTDWKNPTATNWLKGPANIGEREFCMPNPDGTKWNFVPEQMENVASLGYEYDDLAPGAVSTAITMAVRKTNLGIPQIDGAQTESPAMAASDKVEMIGASEVGFSLAGSSIQRKLIKTAPSVRARTRASLEGARGLPDRVFLNFENITGLSDATIFQVYVGLPENAEPSQNKDFLAGSVSLFGVSQASDPSGKHAGSGITSVIEITKIVDKLHLEGNFDIEELSVNIVPLGTIPEAAKISIGRISLYRQFN